MSGQIDLHMLPVIILQAGCKDRILNGKNECEILTCTVNVLIIHQGSCCIGNINDVQSSNVCHVLSGSCTLCTALQLVDIQRAVRLGHCDKVSKAYREVAKVLMH